jgi:hypothetical protein
LEVLRPILKLIAKREEFLQERKEVKKGREGGKEGKGARG